MKRLTVLTVLLFGLFISNPSTAQLNVNVNIGSQPAWGPEGYDHVDYYYMPEMDVYYSVPKKQYVYPDSSKAYISDFASSLLNYSNIRSLGDSIANKRFEGTELKAKIMKQLGKEYKPETIILQGKMANGLYWKDMRIGYLSIGYVNVPESKKNEFDKVLTSFSIK